MTQKKPLVSIIIPMYNTANYILHCIESVISQDYENIEIILIDDGSTDNSYNIASSILSKVQLKKKIIRQVNKGVSAARNRGIKEALGDWIVAIDSDDVIHSSFVSSLVNAVDLTNIYQVVFCNFQVVDIKESCLPPKGNYRISTFTKEEAFIAYMHRNVKFIAPGMLISRSLINKYNILYDEQCRFSEDVLFVWTVLCYVNIVTFIHQPLYNYVFHSGSTMTSSNVEKILTGYKALNRLYQNHLDKLENFDTIKKQLAPRWIFGILHASAKMLSYCDFKLVLKSMEVNSIIKSLFSFGEFKVSLIALIFYINPYFAYLIWRKF